MKLKWDELKAVVSYLEKVLSTVFLSCLLAVFVTIMCYYASHIKLKPLRSEFLDFRAWQARKRLVLARTQVAN